VIVALLWACAAPVTLPEPTGDAAVGRATAMRLVDESRDEVLTDADDRREVTAHVWYPAEPGEPAAYVPELDELDRALDRQTERLFRHIRGHAFLDARRAGDAAPVVVFSHGGDRISSEYTFLIEELVSHGYAVVALEHPYEARAAVLSDGSVVPYAADAWPELPPVADDGQPDPDTEYATFYRSRAEVQAADASFVLDSLDAGELGLDLDRVAFVGHSIGGVAGGTFCQEDPRAVACVNLDGDSGFGPFYLRDDGTAFDPPFLMITKTFAVTDEQLEGWGLTREEWAANLAAQRETFFGAVTGGSWRIEIDGATHESFGDELYALAGLTGEDPSSHEQHLAWIRAYTLAFLDRAFGRGDGALLDETPPDGVIVDRWE
jgi:pimeloyl-ACP methyl ester carboxylesterase